MKVKDIFADTETKIFVVTEATSDNELEWTIEPTVLELIPSEEENYFVKAKQVFADRDVECFIGIMMPERIAETVIKHNENREVVAENIWDQENTVIPAVASDCYGNYELFYAKENPETGINVLKEGLTKALNKNVVAEDLGYILRDENRTEEAIAAFKISEEAGPSSEYVFLELSRLYKDLRQTDKQLEYEQKFKAGGGIV